MARSNIFDEFRKLLNINTNFVEQNKTTRQLGQLIYLYNQKTSWCNTDKYVRQQIW